MLRHLRLCLALFAGLFLAVASLGQAPSSADTYATSGNPTGNYGTNAYLTVNNHAISYIRFNLSSIPQGSTVNRATLRLFVSAVNANGSFDVYQLNTSWSEMTLTYNNAPALGTSATGVHPIAITTANQQNFVVVDISPVVQSWLNGSLVNNGVALALTSIAGQFSFESKESTSTSHQPELEVLLTGPAGPAGPQGPQGPQGLSGADGQTGPQGPTGPQGLQGLQGVAGTNGVGFDFRNAFDNSLAYAVNDVVSYAGSSYAAIASSQGPNNPTPDQNPSAWALMAQQGSAGPIGPAGAQGQQGVQGPVGPQGSKGDTGAVGAQGPQGPMGPQGLQGVQGVAGTNGLGFDFRNAFDNSLAYAVNDVVSYAGSSYAAIASSQGPNNPTPDRNPSAWALMAQQGSAGPIGPAGAQGQQGVQGPVGPQGSKGDTGAVGAQGLQGPTGPQGLQGVQGVAGTNGLGFDFRNAFDKSLAYLVNDVVSYAGSSYAAIASSQGPNNPTPDQNPSAWALMAQQGSAGPIGPAGAQGQQGVQGPVGPQGSKGDTGAVGAQGLQGPTGPQGLQGVQGVAGTNGLGFDFRNAFDKSLAYLVNDVVSYAGSSYAAIASSQGPNNPTPDQNPSAWALMAQQGSAGPIGPAGAQGPQGVQGPVGPQGSKGDTGAVGAQGPQGPIGPQGLQGVQGVAGTNGLGFDFRNAFDNSLAYAVNDVVSYAGSSYAAIASSQGPNNPTPDQNPSAWALMAQQGSAGPIGPAGAQGQQGVQGPVGPQGSKGDTGAVGAQGPQGPTGPQGQQGLQGVAGTNGLGFNFRNAFDKSLAYLVNDVVSYAGSSYAAIASSQGPNNPTPDQNPSAWALMAQQGSAGALGPVGPVGPVGPQGSQGPAGAQGPQGAQGATGPVGAQGAQGIAGPQGAIGPVGPMGPQGPQGPAGTMDPRYTVTLCQINHEGSGNNGSLQSSDSLWSQCINALPSTVTVTSVQCVADASGNSTVQIATNSGLNLLASQCRLGNTLTSCPLNGAPVVNSGQWLNTALVPDNQQKSAHCVVAGIY